MPDGSILPWLAPSMIHALCSNGEASQWHFIQKSVLVCSFDACLYLPQSELGTLKVKIDVEEEEDDIEVPLWWHGLS